MDKLLASYITRCIYCKIWLGSNRAIQEHESRHANKKEIINNQFKKFTTPTGSHKQQERLSEGKFEQKIITQKKFVKKQTWQKRGCQGFRRIFD